MKQMNRLTFQKRFRKPLAIIFCTVAIALVLFYSCRKDFANVHSEKSNYALEISYEEEVLSFQEYSVDKTSNLTILQQVSVVPVITRKKVNIGIMADGSSVMEFTKIKPKNPFKVKHETPPDPSAKAKTTKIIGGTAYYFDENGNLLYNTPFKPISFKEFIAAVKKNKNKLNQQLFATNVDSKLKSAPNETIKQINDTLQSVSRPFTVADGLPTNMLGKTFEKVINTKTGALFGSAIYDENHNFIFRSIQTYSSNPEILIPTYTKSESFGKTPQGTDYVAVQIKQIENYSIVNNLE